MVEESTWWSIVELVELVGVWVGDWWSTTWSWWIMVERWWDEWELVELVKRSGASGGGGVGGVVVER